MSLASSLIAVLVLPDPGGASTSRQLESSARTASWSASKVMGAEGSCISQDDLVNVIDHLRDGRGSGSQGVAESARIDQALEDQARPSAKQDRDADSLLPIVVAR